MLKLNADFDDDFVRRAIAREMRLEGYEVKEGDISFSAKTNEDTVPQTWIISGSVNYVNRKNVNQYSGGGKD